MSAAPKKRWTPEEYLAFERSSDQKHEFIDGEIVAMVGASRNHIKISGNAFASLHTQLRNHQCEIYQSEMRVRVNQWRYFYPDIVIVCGEAQFQDDADVDTLLNPTVIIEVLSPSTEKYDRTTKFHFYRGMASVREYMMIAQDSPRVERFVRQDDGSWRLNDFDGMDASFELKSIEATLALADIYQKVTFDKEDV
jgi:Uma2 family endonuclease